MSGRLKKINESLIKANMTLLVIDEQASQPMPIESGGQVPVVAPPGTNPGSLSTHGYHFPPWLMPPAGGGGNAAHPMYPAYLILVNEHPLIGVVLNFGNFLSLMRFIYRPHVPNTLFNRFPFLRQLLDMMGIEGTQLQNIFRDLLRSWMLNNLDYHADVLEDLFPHLFGPTVIPGDIIPGGDKGIGAGGVIKPLGPGGGGGPIQTGGGGGFGILDIISILTNASTIPMVIGEQTSPIDRIKEKHREENERIKTKHEREIDIAQRRERNRRRTQRQG